MHEVIGARSQATSSGKFFASTPAEKLTPKRPTKRSLKRAARATARTWRGGPLMYIVGSEKKRSLFLTMSVFENLTPTVRPRGFAIASRRSTIPWASLHWRSLSKAARSSSTSS